MWSYLYLFSWGSAKVSWILLYHSSSYLLSVYWQSYHTSKRCGSQEIGIGPMNLHCSLVAGNRISQVWFFFLAFISNRASCPFGGMNICWIIWHGSTWVEFNTLKIVHIVSKTWINTKAGIIIKSSNISQTSHNQFGFLSLSAKSWLQCHEDTLAALRTSLWWGTKTSCQQPSLIC